MIGSDKIREAAEGLIVELEAMDKRGAALLAEIERLKKVTEIKTKGNEAWEELEQHCRTLDTQLANAGKVVEQDYWDTLNNLYGTASILEAYNGAECPLCEAMPHKEDCRIARDIKKAGDAIAEYDKGSAARKESCQVCVHSRLIPEGELCAGEHLCKERE